MNGPMDPSFYSSWEHLEGLVDAIERDNNMEKRPAGGQQCGMDKSWDLPHNRMSSKRQINWYCRAMRDAIKAIKDKEKK